MNTKVESWKICDYCGKNKPLNISCAKGDALYCSKICRNLHFNFHNEYCAKGALYRDHYFQCHFCDRVARVDKTCVKCNKIFFCHDCINTKQEEHAKECGSVGCIPENIRAAGIGCMEWLKSDAGKENLKKLLDNKLEIGIVDCFVRGDVTKPERYEMNGYCLHDACEITKVVKTIGKSMYIESVGIQQTMFYMPFRCIDIQSGKVILENYLTVNKKKK